MYTEMSSDHCSVQQVGTRHTYGSTTRWLVCPTSWSNKYRCPIWWWLWPGCWDKSYVQQCHLVITLTNVLGRRLCTACYCSALLSARKISVMEWFVNCPFCVSGFSFFAFPHNSASGSFSLCSLFLTVSLRSTTSSVSFSAPPLFIGGSISDSEGFTTKFVVCSFAVQ